MRTIVTLFGVLALCCGAQALFDYDRRLPFDVQSEPLNSRPDVSVKSGSLQTMSGRRMDFLLIEPTSPAKAKRPGIVFQHGGGQSMRTYMGDRNCAGEGRSRVLDSRSALPVSGGRF